jgi:SNF2 family DNA or RNA helicase
MVQIINPNFLGNYDEFRKSFGDKIEAGMAVDATTEEIEEMAEHAFILHRDLQPMVLRYE